VNHPHRPDVYEGDLRLDSHMLVAPGIEQFITMRPQMIFRSKKWVIEEGAESFEVVDILCGLYSQMEKLGIGRGETVRGTFFKQKEFRLDTLSVGDALKVVVRNTSPEPRNFKSKMIGDCV
jgi:hypothetical protein